MRRPDWWNWPPFMTVRRHNRIVTDIIEQAQAAVNAECARAAREGRAQVHSWAVEANANVFCGSGSPITNARSYAAFQQAEHMFAPKPTYLKEAINAVTGS